KLNIKRDEDTLFTIRSESHKGVTPTAEARKKMSLARRGVNNHGWKGGISPLVVRLREHTIPWKMDSLKQYDFKCHFTGVNNPTIEIHHLNKNFSKIVYEAFDFLGLQKHTDMSLYTQKERDELRDKILELHYYYGLGVPLIKKLHRKFHSI